jgi:thymidine kinase
MVLSIVIGNMFSGKTSELIRRLKRWKHIGKKILVVNSAKDTRSSEEVLQSHDHVKFECIKVTDICEVVKHPEYHAAEIIAVDEAQFFVGLKDFIEACIESSKEVVIAGLDADSNQNKFGEILDCIPIACEVIKLSALCSRCKDGTPGPFTKRIVNDQNQELIGGSDAYISTCRFHLTEK